MGKPGPQMVGRYGVDFKLTAVSVSNSPSVPIKDVAEPLCIHAFTHSRIHVVQVVQADARRTFGGSAPKIDTES